MIAVLQGRHSFRYSSAALQTLLVTLYRPYSRPPTTPYLTSFLFQSIRCTRLVGFLVSWGMNRMMGQNGHRTETRRSMWPLSPSPLLIAFNTSLQSYTTRMVRHIGDLVFSLASGRRTILHPHILEGCPHICFIIVSKPGADENRGKKLGRKAAAYDG